MSDIDLSKIDWDKVVYAHVIDPSGKVIPMKDPMHADWFVNNKVSDIPHPAKRKGAKTVSMPEIKQWEEDVLIDAMRKGWWRVRNMPGKNKVLVMSSEKSQLPTPEAMEQILKDYNLDEKKALIRTMRSGLHWEGPLADYLSEYDNRHKRSALADLLRNPRYM